MCFFPVTLHAQELELSVAVTNETCPGNGSLTLTVTNAAPAPPVNYQVFELPNTTTPVYNNTGTTVSNLASGNYLVIATQTVNGNTSTAEQEVTVANEIVALDYLVNSSPSTCNDGIIYAMVSQGNPVSYEILSGPVTVPPQQSDTFEGLPAGVYSVRVIDACGEGIVKTVTVLSAASVLSISNSIFPDAELPACDLITLRHTIDPEDPDIPMVLPITAVFTLYPPDGDDPITYTATAVGSQAPPQMLVEIVIPFYYDTNYYYDVVFTDGCGTTYNMPNNLIRQKLTATPGFDDAGCGEKFMLLNVFKYVAPYTIEFTEWPEGFYPEDLNPEHPDFSTSQIAYGGEDVPVPVGVYEFTVTDACGRSENISIELEEFEAEAEAAVFNSDCENNLGRTVVTVPGFVLIGGSILEGPDEFTENNEMPFDLSGYVNEDDAVEIGGLPPGTYVFEVADDCGNTYLKEIIIPDFSAGGISPIARPDCTEGLGTLRVGGNYALTSAIVTVAPPEFGTTPFDADAYISNLGTLYMDNLPPGQYKVKVTTNCTPETEVTANVPAYSVTESSVGVTRYCGSFDVSLQHSSNASVSLSFWLQKLINPETNEWGHPAASNIYPEGTEPNEINSMLMTNGETLYTLINTGQYRVVKVFQTFGSGEPTKICIEVLDEFEFYDNLDILGVSSLTCAGDIADIEVNAVGAEPMQYRIIEKNGDTSFLIDNGNNNIFTGLESASYKVRVDDPCGNFDTWSFNVADLPSLVYASAPPNLERCDEGDDATETFNLSEQDELIIDGQDTSAITLTYHTTFADADNGVDAIPVSYTAATGSVTLYARITSNQDSDCYAITAFDVIVKPLPHFAMDSSLSLCEGESIMVLADAGFDSYVWSTGATTRNIIVSEAGIYTVTAQNQYGCEATNEITITASSAPRIATIDVEDWTDEDNVITVLLEDTANIENYEYSIDGINYQDSNTFTGLAPGPYIVYVRDKFDCGLDAGEAFLLTYPKFFTPNGDNINDTWRIAYALKEPNMRVYIFDRYGKVITSFGANSQGWDGTFNGNKLPSTDYWFVVVRENGKEYKGHFSMVR
jgi:gliding motility-associated-like protein